MVKPRIRLGFVGVGALFVGVACNAILGTEPGVLFEPDVAPIPDAATAVRDTAIPDTAVWDTAIPDTAVRDTAVHDAAVCPPLGALLPGMVRIPAGTFMMGSTASADQQPVHAVDVCAFDMDVTEVTTDAYATCVSAGVCTPAGTGQFCNVGVGGRGNHPVNCVRWNDARAYCEWAGKRLPSEEEWEYAARGTAGNEYPWGNTPPPSNQLCWNGAGNDLYPTPRTSTCVVGSYPAGNTPLGLKDMAGNVWEWTSSGYSLNYSAAPDTATRVNRGGSWHNIEPVYARTANRARDSPVLSIYYLGFRCSRAL